MRLIPLCEEQPTRAAGLSRLTHFVPRAGKAYATRRNSDLGLDRDNVSSLSPWLRHRLVLEQEVVTAVLQEHSFASAEKFIQEVVWRTYWKGWLQMRPKVWQDYCAQRDSLLDQLSAQQLEALERAELGQTGISCFDHWSQELINTGYLHNHTRMWFASIWIFTLQLPWQLGADFFLRHLLDGDPASNTLSWRWVGGLQTVGKHYLARASNISKFTNGQFNPAGELNESAEPLPPEPAYAKHALKPLPGPDYSQPAVLLLHEDELYPESLPVDWSAIEQVVAVQTTHQRSSRQVSEPVTQFVDKAITDCSQRVEQQVGKPVVKIADQALSDYLQQQGIEQLITPLLPVGPTQDGLKPALDLLQSKGIRLAYLCRPWDNTLWPHATHGYFRFKQVLPDLVRQLDAMPLG